MNQSINLLSTVHSETNKCKLNQQQPGDRTHTNTNECEHKSVPNKQQYTHIQTYTNRKAGQSLVYSPFITSGQETKPVYSYNPGARTGSFSCKTANL